MKTARIKRHAFPWWGYLPLLCWPLRFVSNVSRETNSAKASQPPARPVLWRKSSQRCPCILMNRHCASCWKGAGERAHACTLRQVVHDFIEIQGHIFSDDFRHQHRSRRRLRRFSRIGSLAKRSKQNESATQQRVNTPTTNSVTFDACRLHLFEFRSAARQPSLCNRISFCPGRPAAAKLRRSHSTAISSIARFCSLPNPCQHVDAGRNWGAECRRAIHVEARWPRH